MSIKKVKDVDSMYSGTRTKRSRIFDDISCSSNVTSSRWASILSCCWKRNRETQPTLKEYNPNEWDYIVEKLVVKRVPLSLYATEEDFQEFIEERNNNEPPYGPAVKEMPYKQVYPAIPGTGSSRYFLRNTAREDLSNKSSKNLRFDRDADMLYEDAVQAGPSNYVRDISYNSRMKEEEAINEYLNRFSSLHPDLKQNERPPKDPDPLNLPRSKRSFVENISEIASTKKGPSVKSKKGKEADKRSSNVYLTTSDTSREISTILDDEGIPTRDKNITKYTSSIFRKKGSTTGLQYPQNVSRTRGVELMKGRQIHSEINTLHNRSKLLKNPDDRDSNTKFLHEGSRFNIQYAMNEVAKLNKRELDAGLTSQKKKDLNSSQSTEGETTAEATSYTSEDIKNANLDSGTTLRWKIIIKHHQPTASQTASESAVELPERSTLPVLNDGFNYKSKLMNRNTESSDKIGSQDITGYRNK